VHLLKDRTRKAYQYLYDNADSIIRYEASKALGIDSAQLRSEMIGHPQVQYWLECARQFIQTPAIHNSFDTCLENWMHKLLSFGVRESDDMQLKDIDSFILDFIKSSMDKPFENFNAVIAASWLVCMGYDDKTVTDIITDRVEVIHSFVKDRDYNIHISPKGYPSIPKARAMHPFVDPRLYETGKWKLPTVHDIFAFSCLPDAIKNDPQISSKIDDIIEYILDERYQRLYRGYGLMFVPPNKYYSMGWSVHLDHFFDVDSGIDADSGAGQDGVVLSMEMMSRFKAARESDWFRKTLLHLESFGSDGLYRFPPSYLCEGKNKYYILGGHMGLGENRKSKAYLLLESTAWILRIKQNME
jgi:hypothetical protein